MQIQRKQQESRAGRILHLLCILALLLGACASASQIRGRSETVERGSATSARVDIRMREGVLGLSGGAETLMNAEFSFNLEALNPEVTYKVQDNEGTLTVRQPTQASVSALRDERNLWDIRLNNDLPLDLNVQLVAGEANLILSSLTLRQVDINVGQADARIDLTGERQRDVNVSLTGGAGRMTVRLPAQIGVRVDVEGPIGEVVAAGMAQEGSAFVNQAYGQSEVSMHVLIQPGVGRIGLELSD